MSGLKGSEKTSSMEAMPSYFKSSRKKGGGRESQTWGTGRSSMSYGNVTIDPRIREIQEQGLARNNNLYNELGTEGQAILGNLRNTRSRYEGNQSAYMQSRINPVEQEYSTRQGGLERSIGLRGLGGSSFGEQAMTNFATEKQRGIGDIRAQAEMENLQAITGVDKQIAATLFAKVGQQAQLTGMDNDTAKMMLQQELSALGLGTQQQQLMINAWEGFQNRAMQNRKAIADTIVSGFGMGGGGGSSSPSAGSGGDGGGNTSGSGGFGMGGDYSGWRKYWGES